MAIPGAAPGVELRPGIYHIATKYDTWLGPRTHFAIKEILVVSALWPFHEGETPYSYARRIVAEIDADGRVEDVQLRADIYWGTNRFSGEPVVEDHAEIEYKTPHHEGERRTAT